MSTSPTHVQQHYRLRTDAGLVNSAGTFGTEDAGWSQAVDTNFRVRFTVANTGTGGGTARAWSIWYRLNSGTWTAITTTSAVVKAVDAGSSADNDAITSRQLTAGTGSWQNGLYDESGATTTMALTNGFYTEFEFGLSIVSADVANNDTISLRVYNFNAALNGGYTQDLTAVTVVKAVSLAADPLTVAAPVEAAAALTTHYTFTGNPLAVSAPVLAAVDMPYTLVANSLAVAAPVLGTAVFAQQLVLAAAELSVVAPILTAPDFVHTHVLAGDPLAVSAPVLAPANVSFILAATSLAVAAPVLGATDVVQRLTLTAAELSVVAPVLTAANFAQAHVFAGDPLVVSPPVLDPGSMPFYLPATNLVVAAPVLDAGAIAQQHGLSAGDLAVNAPVLSAPTFLSGIAPLTLGQDTIDYGLDMLYEVDQIIVCSERPTDYATAQAAKLGGKNFGVGNAFTLPQPATPAGRKSVSTAITDGSITADGSVAGWAAIDSVNSRLLAEGILLGGGAVNSGQGFSLDSFAIHLTG